MLPPTTPTISDATSFQRAQAGDREAFIALAEQHLPALYRFVAREVRYHEALGDLMPRRATFTGWLRHLARQVVRRMVQASQRRRRYERVHLEDPLPAGPGIDESGYPLEARRTWKDVIPDRSIPTPEDMILLKETWQTLEVALNQLSADQREVFLLHAVEGLSYAEIAAMLGQPLPHVKSAYRAAREALRQRFFGGNGAPVSGAMADQPHANQGA